MYKQPDLTEKNIVISGDFNPGMFTPAFFRENTDTIINDNQIAVISEDFTGIQTHEFIMKISRKSIETIATDKKHFNTIRDVIVSVINSIGFSPITEMVINTIHHFRMKEELELFAVENAVSRYSIQNNAEIVHPLDEFTGFSIGHSDKMLGCLFISVNDFVRKTKSGKEISASLSGYWDFINKRAETLISGILKVAEKEWRLLQKE